MDTDSIVCAWKARRPRGQHLHQPIADKVEAMIRESVNETELRRRCASLRARAEEAFGLIDYELFFYEGHHYEGADEVQCLGRLEDYLLWLKWALADLVAVLDTAKGATAS